MSSTFLFQIAVCVFGPVLMTRLSKRLSVKVLNPVVLCYLFGIFLANLGLFDFQVSEGKDLAAAAVVLGIPFMLLSTDVVRWIRLAKVTVLSTALCFASVSFVAVTLSPLFISQIEEGWKVAGMLVGTYVGSIPNLAAIGTALDVSPETIVLVQASDVLVGGLYLFFLLSGAPSVFARLLPRFSKSTPEFTKSQQQEDSEQSSGNWVQGWLVVITIAALGGGASLLAPASYQDLVAILGVTILALGASFLKRVRSIKNTYATGEYLFLCFCVSVGTMTRLDGLFTGSFIVIVFTALVVLGAVFLHFLLCKFFKIDRDTYLITSTAGIYSPALVGPMASVLKNKEIVVSGITSGLVGLALGNLLGVGVAYLVRFF